MVQPRPGTRRRPHHVRTEAIQVKILVFNKYFYFLHNVFIYFVRFKDKSDGRFFWNRMLHLPYIRAGVEPGAWLLRVMFGSVEIRTVYVGSKQARAAVISRLSSERAGTRCDIVVG